VGWKQFIASIIGSVAWPLAVLTIAVIFRKPLTRVLSLIKKIGAAGVSVELAEQVAAVRDAGELVEAEEGTQPPDVIALDPAILQLAKTFPEAALVQAFKELEGVILQIRARLPDDKQHRTLNEVLKALAAKKYITDSVVALFQKVREARNTVAHARGEDEMSFGEAIELIRQIKLLQSLLMRVYSQLPPRSDRI
jgi:hypothetical protein